MRCHARWERLRFRATRRSASLLRASARPNDEDLNPHGSLGRCVALEIDSVGVAHIGTPLPDRDRYEKVQSTGGAEP
jgi:hypothetical protein